MPNQVPTLAGGGIDWQTVHGRLRRSREALDAAFSGRGAWAEEVLRRREEELAAQDSSPSEDRTLTPFLVAQGENGHYALELRRLGLILPLPRVARVPGSEPELLGLIAINGRATRLFDLDRLCGGAPAASREGGFAILLRGLARPAALRVHLVETVMDLDMTRVGNHSEAGTYIRAFTEDRVAILDVAAIIDSMKGMGKNEA